MARTEPLRTDTAHRLPIRATVSAAYVCVAMAPFGMLGLAAVPLLSLVLLAWAEFQVVEAVLNGAPSPVFILFAGYLLQYALGVLILGALVHGAARVDRREPFGVAQSLVASLRRLPQLMGAAFYLFVIGTSLFFGLFSQPPHLEYALPPFLAGIAVALLLPLSIPVCLKERRGPIAGTIRAFRLARGNRLRLVAAIIIATVPIIGATILLMSFAGYPIFPLIAALGVMAATAVLTALTAVAYRELAPPETTAAAGVFD